MSLFKSTYNALAFAYQFNGLNISTPHLCEMQPSKARSLGGLNGAGEAGSIKRAVKELGEVAESLIVARFSPSKLPCSCHRSCCSGWVNNADWQHAVNVLSKSIDDDVFCRVGDANYRAAITGRYFSRDYDKKPIEFIADNARISRATAYQHYKAIKLYFRGTRSQKGVEQVIIDKVDEILRDLKIVGEFEDE